MKKRIISLLTMFCLVLPCFFAVACKKKNEEPKVEKAYTYSVVLKNAKGKIDENALHSEYDYKKQENISWTNTDNDYSLSVTRTGVVSDSLDVNLLEGFDYSNLSFSVNSKDAEAKIKSGEKTGCEKDAYLTDRQFSYEYSDMKSDTSLVVDFSDCEWAKVTLDFSELESKGITCYTTKTNFATINTPVEDALEEITSTTVEVDYGTIFAFDCAQKLVFEAETSENFQDLTYAKYASRYYRGTNMIQYLTAKQDGDCKVYSAERDYSKRGTLRVLDCANYPAYATIEDLQNNRNALSVVVEKESYGGSTLNINVISQSKMFMKLNEEARAYNYYVVEKIDGYMSVGKLLEQKTIAETDIVYLDINIANADGSDAEAKYLVRSPKVATDFYVVDAKVENGDILVKNADYVLIGRDNRQSNKIPTGNSGNIFFGFKNTKDVEISLNEFISDVSSDYLLKQLNASITTYNISRSNSESRYVGTTIVEPVTSATKTIDCYESSDTFKFYQVKVKYFSDRFSNANVNLNTADFELYEGEKVYYTTDISDDSSWQALTNESVLAISSEQTRTIFYYFESDRADSFLQIQKPTGEVVSVTGEIRDCFGRQMTGTLMVGESEINLSKIRYLDIKPGNYASYTAKLIREYDRTYHSINLSALGSNKLRVSIGSFSADASTFKDAVSLDNFNIKYNGYEAGGSIYYYFNENTNKYLVLKDAEGKVVSSNTYVMESVSKPLQISGNYVYRLALIGGYYADDEVFTLEVVDATYGLKNSSDEPVEIFNSQELTASQEYLIEGNVYYFVAEEGKDFDIIDSMNNVVVSAIESVLMGSESVYKFTFAFPNNANYVNGTNFKLVVRN